MHRHSLTPAGRTFRGFAVALSAAGRFTPATITKRSAMPMPREVVLVCMSAPLQTWQLPWERS